MEALVAIVLLALTLGRNRNGNGGGVPVVMSGNQNGWPYRAHRYSDITGEEYAVGIHVEMVMDSSCATRAAVVDNETEALNQLQIWAIEQGPAPAGLRCPW